MRRMNEGFMNRMLASSTEEGTVNTEPVAELVTVVEESNMPSSGAIGTEGIRRSFVANTAEESPAEMDPTMDGYLQQMTTDGVPVSKSSTDL